MSYFAIHTLSCAKDRSAHASLPNCDIKCCKITFFSCTFCAKLYRACFVVICCGEWQLNNLQILMGGERSVHLGKQSITTQQNLSASRYANREWITYQTYVFQSENIGIHWWKTSHAFYELYTALILMLKVPVDVVLNIQWLRVAHPK